jgi:Zn-dependent M28 family amino/carboxypeptidase
MSTSRARRVAGPVILFCMITCGVGGVSWMTGACSPARVTPPAIARQAPLADLEAQLTRDVNHLAMTIGERHGDGREAALEAAAVWIEAELVAAGWSVVREAYTVDGEPFRNVYVEVPGSGAPEEVVVIGAHYDSAEGTPGADDNATGVAALLYTARALVGVKPARTLRLVFFTNEEPPYFKGPAMGSLVHAKRTAARGERVVAMASLEMLGFYAEGEGVQTYPLGLGAVYPAHGDYIAVVGDIESEPLVQECAAALRGATDMQIETLAAPRALAEISFSDQWSFWQLGWPGVMITDTGFLRNAHYHLDSDTPDKLDFARMARVTRAIPALAATLSRAP